MTQHPTDELSGYVDGEVSSTRMAEIAAHVAECADCAKVVVDLHAARRAAGIHEPVDAVTAKRFLAENRKRRVKETLAPKPAAASFSLGDVGAYGMIMSLIAVIVIAVFVALGGPLKNMFSTAVSTSTMGQNQASLSAGIY